MNEIIYNFFAGYIQGITEFLPISSSGHLLLLGMNLDTAIMLHFGTVFSIIIYYKKYILKLSREFIKGDRTLLYFIIIGCLPISIVGLLSKDLIESIFYNDISLLPYTFMLTAIFLFLTKDVNSQKGLTLKIVFIVGILQVFALLPGVSRSGITIASLLIFGINRKDAVRFSFLMAIPLILGSTFLTIYFSNYNFESMQYIAFGTIISFLFGWIAIYLTNNFLENKKYWLFSIYCFIISILVLILDIN